MPVEICQSARCRICSRDAMKADEFCIFHVAALTRVKEHFSKWQEAYEDISWERYLERILDLKETGDSSKDIARHLLNR